MKVELLEYSEDGQGIVKVILEGTESISGKLEGVNLESVDFQVDYEILDEGKYKLILFVGDEQAETMKEIVIFEINTSYAELLLRLRKYLENNMANYSEKIVNEYKELTKSVTVCTKVGDIWDIQRKDGIDFRVFLYDEYADIVMAKGYSRIIDGQHSIVDIKEILDSEIE